MRKRIELGKPYHKRDRGRGAYFVQDGVEYDKFGWSLIDYPEEIDEQEERETKKETKASTESRQESKENKEVEILLSKSRQPYKSRAVAEQALKRKKLDTTLNKVVPYEGGFGIAQTINKTS